MAAAAMTTSTAASAWRAPPLKAHHALAAAFSAPVEVMIVRRLEEALTRGGTAAAIGTASKEFLSDGCVFSWPLGRVVGRAAVARYFRVLQVLFVDDSTVDEVAVGDAPRGGGGGRVGAGGRGAGAPGGEPSVAAPRRVVLARLTHRLTPRLLDALAPLPKPLPSSIGLHVGAGGAMTEKPRHRWQPGQPLFPPGAAAAAASLSAAPSPLPPRLRPLASWLRARCTFTVVDNATYYFAPDASSGGGGGGAEAPSSSPAPAPKIELIRAEIALVSLLHALPFGASVWHGVCEPAMGALASVLDAVWSAWVRPLVVPWAQGRLLYHGFDAL